MGVSTALAFTALRTSRVSPGYEPLQAVWFLVRELGVGLLVGWAVGRLAPRALRRIAGGAPGVELVATFAVAAIAFGAAGSLEGSGFLAVYVAGLALGCAVRAFNGLLIAALGVNPFVTTLGSYNIAIGVATTLSGGRPVQSVPDLFAELLYSGSIFGLPVAIAIAVVIGFVLHLLLTYTVFGRSLYLVGGGALFILAYYRRWMKETKRIRSPMVVCPCLLFLLLLCGHRGRASARRGRALLQNSDQRLGLVHHYRGRSAGDRHDRRCGLHCVRRAV